MTQQIIQGIFTQVKSKRTLLSSDVAASAHKSTTLS